MACNNNKQDSAKQENFNKEKWSIKSGNNYPFRDNMLNSVLYNDSIRKLNRMEIIELLGKPDKDRDSFLYYRINEDKLGAWTLHTKTLVIKFSNDSSLEWIKLHQ
jgi:hypothetical protein